jgi:hypothetical protein
MIAPLVALALGPLLSALAPAEPVSVVHPAPIGPPPPPLAVGVGTYGSDGSDGELIVAAGTTMTIDLASQGTYLPDEWVVRFDYVRVEIQDGATVNFVNHPSRAPVVWLVQQDVQVAPNAVVSLNGQSGTNAQGSFGYAEPGPGGFRGGRSSFSGIDDLGSAGFGPGGALGSTDGRHGGGGGSYRTAGGSGGAGGGPSGPTYGGPAVFQLIGGSSGAAGRTTGSSATAGGGGAGGGAILIAADGLVSIDGIVRANGGAGRSEDAAGGGGAGGAIRLASLVDIVVGPNGQVTVNRGSGGGDVTFGGSENGGVGGWGRVRLECPGASPTIAGSVPDSASYGEPEPAFRMSPPRLWIASIGGMATPPQGDLTAGLGFNGSQADMQLFDPGAVDIVVDSQDLPLNSLVFLRIGRATGHADLLGPIALRAGTAVTFEAVDLTRGFSALQARAVLPQLP